MLAEEFEKPAKEKSRKQKRIETLRHKLDNPTYKFSKYSNLSKTDKMVVEWGYTKWGEDGVNIAKRYLVNHYENENTMFMRYLFIEGQERGEDWI